MSESKQELRNVEARWLKDQMKRRGLSHAKLHEQLTNRGFTGQLNNVTMWTTARTSIPNEWLVKLIEILQPNKSELIAVDMYTRRMPYLKPLFIASTETTARAAKITDSGESTNGFSDRKKPPKRIYYIARYGQRKGEHFVPHKNRNGMYQGGISRFARDVEEFESIEEIWERLRSDPNFKIRMTSEETSGPASLISRDSLLFDWKD